MPGLSPAKMNSFIRDMRKVPGKLKLPLKDIRVLCPATVVAAPYAATLFGDLGAEVIRIEPIIKGKAMPDATRGWGPIEGISPSWASYSRNQFPITLNLKTEEGKAILRELIKVSDVLIDNMLPGKFDKLGFPATDLLSLNPGLIISRVSGYGQTGPKSGLPGFGTLAEAFSGFTFMNAHPDGAPTNPPLALADLIVAQHLAFGIMVALRGQERGVRGGQELELSLYEPLFSLLAPTFLEYHLTGKVPQPTGNRLSYVYPRDSFMTRDGYWVALSASAQRTFERLMELIGKPEYISDPRFSQENRTKSESVEMLYTVIADWISKRRKQDVLRICEEKGITIGPVYNMQDVENDPQVAARESIIEIEDPGTGKTLRMPNVPLKFSESSGLIRFAGLPVGAANEVILADLLDYHPNEIQRLSENGVI